LILLAFKGIFGYLVGWNCQSREIRAFKKTM